MDDKEMEEKYERTAKMLRVLGIILLIVGIGCVVTGTADLIVSSSSWEEPTLFWLCFVGFPIIAGGAICTSFGFHKKVSRFMMSQQAPVAKDYANYMIDGTSDSVSNMAGKVASSVADSSKVEGVDANTCSKCGTRNPLGAKFCSKCGAALTKKCPYCGAENDDAAKFCNNCGKSLF